MHLGDADDAFVASRLEHDDFGLPGQDVTGELDGKRVILVAAMPVTSIDARACQPGYEPAENQRPRPAFSSLLCGCVSCSITQAELRCNQYSNEPESEYAKPSPFPSMGRPKCV